MFTLTLITWINLLQPATPGPDTSAKDFVAQAKERGEARDFAQAITLMKKALALSPKNDLFWAITSDLELKAGKFADGAEHAAEAIKLNDKDGGYFVVGAANAYGNHDLGLARAYCEQVLAKGPGVYGRRACQDAMNLKDLLIKKEYTLFFNLDPQKARSTSGTFQVSLPRNGLPYQSATFEIGDVKSHRLIKGDVNDVLAVVPQGTKPFALTIKVTTEPYYYRKELAAANGTTASPEAKTFLGAMLLVDPKSPALKKVVAELKRDRPLVTVNAILDWMKKNIEYKLLQNDSIVEHDFKNVDEIIKRGHAECRGYALLFTGLCRAADVPARPIWGMLRVPPGTDKKFGGIVSHNWAEVYIAGAGWLPVDPQRPKRWVFCPTITCGLRRTDARA